MIQYTVQHSDFSFEEKGQVSANEFASLCSQFEWSKEKASGVSLEEAGKESCPANLGISNGKQHMMVLSDDGVEYHAIIGLPKSLLQSILAAILPAQLFPDKELSLNATELASVVDEFFESRWEKIAAR